MARGGIRRGARAASAAASLLGAASLLAAARAAAQGAPGRVVRVALAEDAPAPRVSATGAFAVHDGGAVLAHGAAGAAWTAERRGAQLRLVGPAGGTSWRPGPLVVRAAPGAMVTVAGRAYRGELWLHPGEGGGVTVVERVPVEDYLRGVVPLELPADAPGDLAAVQAQAVAARSYAVSRLAEFLPREAAVARARLPFDLRATVRDQVYGGAAAERAASDRAVASTAGLVLRYGGAIATAPYHSACGGSTAAADELWAGDAAPYLRAVDDRVPGTDRAYCELSPRFRWTRAWDGAGLDAALARYLRAAAGGGGGAGGSGGTGAAEGVELGARTASGRVAAVTVRTTAGRWVLRGNAIRFALRDRGGAILPSTYFSAAAGSDGFGRVTQLLLRGQGNGHGVGLCQWGAVGRARAGQDFRAILRTYYPGTTVERVE